jgi:alkylation response protein AidB-like acyl-CoA dehydrogenase
MDFGLSEQHNQIVERVREFARERVAPRAPEIDRTGEYPRDLVSEAAGLGLMAMTVRPEFGGAGLDVVTCAAVIEVIAGASATLAVILSVNNSLVAEPIQQFGSDRQRTAWLPKLARGEAIGSFALSEPQSGSDAANQLTTARKEGDEYLIRGNKVWVANAAAADLVVVFASTDPRARSRGISAFLVPTDAPGVVRTPSPDSLGVHGLGCMDLRFENVRRHANDTLGDTGAGFSIAKHALAGGRIAIAAQALGVGAAALEEAVSYSRRRYAFGQPIGDFQAIQFQLADLATDLEAARMLTWKAADARGRSGRAFVEAAMAKLQASEAAHRAADRALQILASEGYRRGSTIERLFRDIRAAEIYQGTSEVQRMIIARHVLNQD